MQYHRNEFYYTKVSTSYAPHLYIFQSTNGDHALFYCLFLNNRYISNNALRFQSLVFPLWCTALVLEIETLCISGSLLVPTYSRIFVLPITLRVHQFHKF